MAVEYNAAKARTAGSGPGVSACAHNSRFKLSFLHLRFTVSHILLLTH